MRKLRHEEIPRIDASARDEKKRHPIVVVVDNVRSIHNDYGMALFSEHLMEPGLKKSS